MEPPTITDVNPYEEIWPLEHNAEIWGRTGPGGRFQIQEKEKNSVTELQKKDGGCDSVRAVGL
jgi:hypothetical protein